MTSANVRTVKLRFCLALVVAGCGASEADESLASSSTQGMLDSDPDESEDAGSTGGELTGGMGTGFGEGDGTSGQGNISTETTGGGSTGSETGTGSGGDASTGTTGDDGTSTEGEESTGTAGEESTGTAGDEPSVLLVEEFDRSDGEPLPEGWVVLESSLDIAEHRSGALELSASDAYRVSRVATDLFSAINAEAQFKVRFEDVKEQGVGLYLRSNGGLLQRTTPYGQGYNVYIDSVYSTTPTIRLYKEVDGHEDELLGAGARASVTIDNDVVYHVWFRVVQIDATTTRLQAKIWSTAESEPLEWTVTTDDDEEVLQGTAGGLAIDLYESDADLSASIENVMVLPIP